MKAHLINNLFFFSFYCTQTVKLLTVTNGSILETNKNGFIKCRENLVHKIPLKIFPIRNQRHSKSFLFIQSFWPYYRNMYKWTCISILKYQMQTIKSQLDSVTHLWCWQILYYFFLLLLRCVCMSNDFPVIRQANNKRWCIGFVMLISCAGFSIAMVTKCVQR